MEINLDHPVYTVHGLMKIVQAQGIPGTLCLLKDSIYFEADGFLKGSEIKNVFHFDEIKSVKFGLSLNPFRIVITEKEGENWIFDYVSRADGKKFVELYNDIKESN